MPICLRKCHWEIEDLSSGSIFASGSSHLDFATQDQIVFTLLPLGDSFLLPQVSVHPEAVLLPVALLYPLGMRLESEPRVTSYSSSASGSIFASGSMAA